MLELAMFGDSIAFGQGADRPADTIGRRLAVALQSRGTSTHLTVHAVPGAMSAGLAGQVHAALTSEVDLAVVIVGANDLTHFVPVPLAAAQLGQAVRMLRDRGVAVVVVPAPDLSTVPFVPVQFRALVQAASVRLRATQTRAALDEGAYVVRTDGVAAQFAAEPNLFSTDGFHPSSKGYHVIADAVIPAALSALDV